MKRLPFLVLTLLLLTAANKQPTPEAPAPVGVTVTRGAGARLLRAVLPGTVSAVELARRADQGLDLVFLLGSVARTRSRVELDSPAGGDALRPVLEDVPAAGFEAQDLGGDSVEELLLTPEGTLRSLGLDLVFSPGSESWTLYRLDPGGSPDGALRPLLEGLPPGSLGALDLDRDGVEELLLEASGTLRSLGTAAAPRRSASLLSTDRAEVLLPSRWSGPSVDGVVMTSIGRARLLVPRDGLLAADLDLSLPMRPARRSQGVDLTSPRILPIVGDSTRLAAVPHAVGRQRLRTLLLEPDGASEAWSLLPAAEDVDEVHYSTIDGRPSLIVTTTYADKLGIFEGKKLRVFALGVDRTQAGRPPILAAQTASHRWFPVVTTVADVDRDGREDVVALQRGGMGGGETIVETFFGRGDGAFTSPGRRQKWEIRGEASSYGGDLTGDGIADLAVLDDEALHVVAGTADPRRVLLAREPLRVSMVSWGVRGDSIRAMRAADLDGDGKSEVILLGRIAKDRDVILVVSLDRAAVSR